MLAMFYLHIFYYVQILTHVVMTILIYDLERVLKIFRFKRHHRSKSPHIVTAAMKLKDACSSEGKLTNVDSVLKSRDITLLTKVHTGKAINQ